MSEEQNLVLKFGGSSVATPERIAHVVNIVKTHPRSRLIVAVIVSAFQGVTDNLQELGARASSGENGWRTDLEALVWRHREAAAFFSYGQTTRDLEGVLHRCNEELLQLLERAGSLGALRRNLLDEILSYGERLSAEIVAQAFRVYGVPAKTVDARAMIKTDSHFGCAGVLEELTTPMIPRHIENAGALPVVTGFIGSTVEGETTTLGRGGSDYTATIVAASLGHCMAEIWTDTDGVMTADPKRVPTARPVRHLSYEEAEHLFEAGALVVYPPTVGPARRRGLKVSVRNTFHPEEPGTMIDGFDDNAGVFKSVASRNSTVLCSLRDERATGSPMPAWIAQLVPDAPVLPVALSSGRKGVAIHTHDVALVRRMEESGLFERGSVVPSCAVVTMVGSGIDQDKIEKARLRLKGKNIPILAVVQGSGGSAGYVVESDHEQEVVECFHTLIPADGSAGWRAS